MNFIKFDTSLKIKYRSIDFLCFSEQYYYTLIILGGGITMMVWSINICYNYRYIPFTDLSSCLFIFLYFVIFAISHYLFKYIQKNVFNLWTKPFQTLHHTNRSSIKVEDYLKDYYNIYQSKKVIKQFIRHKKQTVLQNLDKFLQKKDFFNHNGLLFQIYHDIEKNLSGTQIDFF